MTEKTVTTTPAALEVALQERLGQSVFGVEDTVHALCIALIARGHLLLEGPPGVGKTLLCKAFAVAIGGSFKRVQGTADLMPTDITGVHVFNDATRDFEFREGPVFADVVLVDEINRSGPKTQSALLQAMEEREVTIDRNTFPLPQNFVVVATQNPREFEGTYPLPESQLDRFMIRASVSYPPKAQETKVISEYNLPDAQQFADDPLAIIDDVRLGKVRSALAEIHFAEELAEYIVDIATATRLSADLELGLSSRGVLALARCARIESALRGAEYTTPDDVKAVAPLVIAHRLMLNSEAMLSGITTQQVCNGILETIPVPR